MFERSNRKGTSGKWQGKMIMRMKVRRRRGREERAGEEGGAEWFSLGKSP